MVKSQKDVRCCLKIIFYSIFLFTFISVCIESGLVHFTPYYLIKSEIFHKSQSARNIIFLQPETKVFTKPEIILPERIKILNVNKKFVNRFNHFQEKCDEFLNSSSSTPKIFEEGQNILKIANFFPTDRANFDPKHNLLYCFPPKSGTTNWNRLATSLYHEISIKDLIEKYDLDYVYNSLPTLQKLAKMQEDSNEKFSGKSLSDLIDSDNNDIKSAILLSRHPLTRLYSSWGHRFSDVNPSHRIVFRPQIMKIKQKYQEIDDYPQPKGIFVTFSSFLRFLISDEAHDRGQGGLGNVHWLRVIDLCKPCELKNVYNFIVSLETSEEDADIFLSTVESQADNKLNFSQLVGKFPNAYYQDDKSDDKERLNLPNSKGEVPQTKDVGARIDGIKKYYREHVDSDLVRKIYEKYFWDFELFGYNLDGFIV